MTDLAEVLSAEQSQELTALLDDHKERTGVAVAVLVVDTTGPRSIELFSRDVASLWKMSAVCPDHALIVLAVRDAHIGLKLSDSIDPVARYLTPDLLLARIRAELSEERPAEGVRKIVLAVVHATEDFRPGKGVLFFLLLGIITGAGLMALRLGIRRWLRGQVPLPSPRPPSWVAILSWVPILVLWPLVTALVPLIMKGDPQRICIVHGLGTLQGMVLINTLAARRSPRTECAFAAATAGVLQVFLTGITLGLYFREPRLDGAPSIPFLGTVIGLEALVLLAWYVAFLGKQDSDASRVQFERMFSSLLATRPSGTRCAGEESACPGSDQQATRVEKKAEPIPASPPPARPGVWPTFECWRRPVHPPDTQQGLTAPVGGGHLAVAMPGTSRPPLTADVGCAQAVPAGTVAHELAAGTVVPRCRDCGEPLQPDRLFCARCGGSPQGEPAVAHALLIGRVGDRGSRAELARLLAGAGRGLGEAEIERLLARPPALLFVDAPRSHVEVLRTDLAAAGVQAQVMPADDRAVPYLREALQSMLHDWWALSALGVVGAATVVGSMALALWTAPIGGALLVALLVRQVRRYGRGQRLDAQLLASRLQGTDPELVAECRELLRALDGDEETRRALSACVLEYHAVARQLRAAEPVRRELLAHMRPALERLLRQVIEQCHGYIELTRLHAEADARTLRARIEEQEKTIATTSVAESRSIRERALAEQRQELAALEELERKRGYFHERLLALSAALGALRGRVVAINVAAAGAAGGAELDGSLRDLDGAVAAIEKTLAELQG